MMVVEIAGGWTYNSMALLADGWHMSSHTLALGMAAFAYLMARRLANDRRFAFGTWKIEILGGFTSAFLLLLLAASMADRKSLVLGKAVSVRVDLGGCSIIKKKNKLH